MKKVKIIIEDLVKHHSGGKEEELPVDTTIRFEIDGTRFSVKAIGNGIAVYKVSQSGLDVIAVRPHSTNCIKIS